LPSPSIIDVKARIARLSGSYFRADGEIAGIIADYKRPITGRQRRIVVGKAQAILNDLGEKRNAQVAGLVRLGYSRGVHLVEPDDKLSSKDMPGISILVKSLTGRLMTAEEAVIRNFRDAASRVSLLSSSAALQESQATEDRLSNTLALVDRRGGRWGMAQYAEMAIRTVAHEALSEGTLTAMKAHEWDLVSVSSEANPSPTCENFNGKTYSLDSNPDYPKLTAVPPFHPQCEHFIYKEGL
jgi:minor capsid protein 2